MYPFIPFGLASTLLHAGSAPAPSQPVVIQVVHVRVVQDSTGGRLFDSGRHKSEARRHEHDARLCDLLA